MAYSTRLVFLVDPACGVTDSAESTPDLRRNVAGQFARSFVAVTERIAAVATKGGNVSVEMRILGTGSSLATEVPGNMPFSKFGSTLLKDLEMCTPEMAGAAVTSKSLLDALNKVDSCGPPGSQPTFYLLSPFPDCCSAVSNFVGVCGAGCITGDESSCAHHRQKRPRGTNPQKYSPSSKAFAGTRCVANGSLGIQFSSFPCAEGLLSFIQRKQCLLHWIDCTRSKRKADDCDTCSEFRSQLLASSPLFGVTHLHSVLSSPEIFPFSSFIESMERGSDVNMRASLSYTQETGAFDLDGRGLLRLEILSSHGLLGAAASRPMNASVPAVTFVFVSRCLIPIEHLSASGYRSATSSERGPAVVRLATMGNASKVKQKQAKCIRASAIFSSVMVGLAGQRLAIVGDLYTRAVLKATENSSPKDRQWVMKSSCALAPQTTSSGVLTLMDSVLEIPGVCASRRPSSAATKYIENNSLTRWLGDASYSGKERCGRDFGQFLSCKRSVLLESSEGRDEVPQGQKLSHCLERRTTGDSCEVLARTVEPWLSTETPERFEDLGRALDGLRSSCVLRPSESDRLKREELRRSLVLDDSRCIGSQSQRRVSMDNTEIGLIPGEPRVGKTSSLGPVEALNQEGALPGIASAGSCIAHVGAVRTDSPLAKPTLVGDSNSRSSPETASFRLESTDPSVQNQGLSYRDGASTENRRGNQSLPCGAHSQKTLTVEYFRVFERCLVEKIGVMGKAESGAISFDEIESVMFDLSMFLELFQRIEGLRDWQSVFTTGREAEELRAVTDEVNKECLSSTETPPEACFLQRRVLGSVLRSYACCVFDICEHIAPFHARARTDLNQEQGRSARKRSAVSNLLNSVKLAVLATQKWYPLERASLFERMDDLFFKSVLLECSGESSGNAVSVRLTERVREICFKYDLEASPSSFIECRPRQGSTLLSSPDRLARGDSQHEIPGPCPRIVRTNSQGSFAGASADVTQRSTLGKSVKGCSPAEDAMLQSRVGERRPSRHPEKVLARARRRSVVMRHPPSGTRVGQHVSGVSSRVLGGIGESNASAIVREQQKQQPLRSARKNEGAKPPERAPGSDNPDLPGQNLRRSRYQGVFDMQPSVTLPLSPNDDALAQSAVAHVWDPARLGSPGIVRGISDIDPLTPPTKRQRWSRSALQGVGLDMEEYVEETPERGAML